MHNNPLRKLTAAVFTSLVLAGCGGDNSTTNTAPMASKRLAQAIAVNSTATFTGARGNYTITEIAAGFQVADNVGTDGITTHAANTRLKFTDISVALDIEGNAGQIYRLYQAAFDRQPDVGGLGFQISAIEVSGLSQTQVSQNFINSPEFSSRYGSLNNTQFVTQLYANVLHRAPDSGGLSFHVGNLNSGALKQSEVLIGFSESPENKAQVLSAIQNGIQFTPYVDPSLPPSITTVQAIITQRCVSCHSDKNTQPGFPIAQAGVFLQSTTLIRQNAARIYQTAVLLETMPFGNITQMTDEERLVIDSWYLNGAK